MVCEAKVWENAKTNLELHSIVLPGYTEIYSIVLPGYTEICGCPEKVIWYWPHSLLDDFVLL